jgi:hypothetical protein
MPSACNVRIDFLTKPLSQQRGAAKRRHSLACSSSWRSFIFDAIDTSDLPIDKNRTAIEAPIRHSHPGVRFESIKANFWTLEDGWPVKLTEYDDIARVQAFVATVAGAHPA